MQEEIWKAVNGYNEAYSISNLGRVRSNKRSVKNGKNTSYIKKSFIMSLSKHLNGYLFVRLRKNGKDNYHSVHRLVSIHFIGTKNEELDVNHLDGNKTNNTVSNLEFCNRSENITHAFTSGLINRDSIRIPIISIDPVTNNIISYKSIREAKKSGFKQSSISLCLNGKQKLHKGLRWKKANNLYNQRFKDDKFLAC